MHLELLKTLDQYRLQRAFNPAEWVDKKCQIFTDYLRDNGLSGAIVAVSGGVDSAVTLALLQRTAQLEGSPLKTVGPITLPIHSSDWALERATELCNKLDVKLLIIDQTQIHDDLLNLICNKICTDPGEFMENNRFAIGQLRSYQRTPINYFIAQIMSSMGCPSLVVGTGNRDEDGYIGFFCKAGDGVCDVQLISDLHKSQVFQVGAYLDIPESILEAVPSADLWDGQTDEEELGFSYDFVELFTGYYLELDDAGREQFIEGLSNEAKSEFDELSKKCVAVHERNRHKFNFPVNL